MRQVQKKMFTYSLTLLAGCVLFFSAAAKNDPPYTSLLQGDSIKAGKTITVMDTVFFNPLLKPTILRTNAVTNIISLRINEYSSVVLPDSFKIDVRIRMIYITKNNLKDSVDKILTIDYNKLKTYKSRDIYYLSDGYQMQVKILQVTPTYATLNKILPGLELENKLLIDRDYVMNPLNGTQMNCSANAIRQISKDVSTIPIYGELKISWLPNRTVEMYDVEWTYIDKSALDNGRYNVGGQLNAGLIFKNNASRIRITADTCMIPLLYDGEGSLFYRVRGIQEDPAGEIIATLWSSDFISDGGLGRHDFTGHERKLNWQATTTFAEEGKRKSVVQYYDGSLRSRQTVTRDNTTKTTVAAETFYDKQGRPVIQVLPAPTLNTLLGYTPGLNTASMNGREYDKGIYDTLINASDFCDKGADSMSVSSGTSLYYSANNPLKNESYHQFIPDAKGYAFAETQYAQDNTGRIIKQGGVGKDFQIGSGHETKYFNGSPEQTDLDALFGTEVGDASHYQKNMIRDANGQYSVSYVDMHGRTIATALAGENPSRLQRLNSYRDSIQSEKLLTKTNNVINGSSIQSSKSLLVTMAGNHTFNYSLGAESLTLQDCQQRGICYDCLYDLTITITDDCNNQLLGGNPLVIKKGNFKLFAIDTTCDLAIPLDTSFSRWLEPGSYTITKELSISQEGMQYYRDSLYLQHNTCKTYEDILNEQKEIVRNEINCNGIPETQFEYQSYRRDLSMDLYPLIGQYADTAADRQCYSIFNTVFNNYQRSDLQYKDDDGNPALVMNSAGNMVIPQQLSVEEFIQNFQTSWANALLPLHPEYPLLMKYESFSASHEWEEDFSKTETYAEAKAKGYLNPSNSGGLPAASFPSTNPDPLFSAYPESYNARIAIENKLFNFVSINGTAVSLWGFSTALSKCPDTNPINETCVLQWNQPANTFNESLLCEGELDMAWKTFRTQYLTKKHEWLIDYMRTSTGSTAILPPCVANFSKATDLLLQGGFTLTPQDEAASQASANNFYADNCRAFATRWWQQLQSGCNNYTQQDSATVINYLLEVCKQGADITHPYGSSSVKPGSTYRFKNFEEVINFYNDSTGRVTDINCNSYLIDKPLPYEQSAPLVNMPLYGKPSDCECAKISDYYTQFSSKAAQYGTFSNYMAQKYHTNISEGGLDSLRNLCNNTISCKYIPRPINLPTIFQCGIENVCVPCTRVKDLYDNFQVKFPGYAPSKEESDTVQQKINQVFVSYMNQQLGFSKTAQEYLSFLDSCAAYGGNDPSCEALQSLVAEFIPYYDSLKNINPSHWSYASGFSGGQTDGDVHIEEGSLSAPDFYDCSLSQIAYSNDRAFKVNNAYAIEVKIRRGICGYVFSSLSYLTLMPNQDGGMPEVYPSFASTSNQSPGYYQNGGFVDDQLFNRSFDDWTVVKYETTPTKIRIYFDGALIKEFDRSGPAINVLNGFNIDAVGNPQIDWVKFYGSSGELMFEEDFENFPPLKKQDPIYYAHPLVCTEEFANYYNGAFGTNYNFGEIETIYHSVCNSNLNVCGTTADSLIVPSSGVPKPANITCNQLTSTYKNFIADFPDPSKGAIVKVFVQDGGSFSASSSFSMMAAPPSNDMVVDSMPPVPDSLQQIVGNISELDMSSSSVQSFSLAAVPGLWVDSLLQCKQLFEWYFNNHLNTTGYTYENFTDWLVNTCGYKIKQLPCSEEVFVSCDTLQQIKTLFDQQYPASMGNTITATMSVPVHKVSHLMRRFQPNGVFVDESTAFSGASLAAMTWTSGGFWFNIRDNVGFDFRALPAGATINSAALNLYAKPDQIEFFPCCGAHYRRTADNVFGIFERLTDWVIPGKTLWSTQPATDATHSFTIAPISIDNGAGGGITQIFSNQDYLHQSCTALVRDLHTSAWDNKNYGILFRQNLENIGFYKAYTFWGVASPTPVGKKPNLEVNFTASRCDLFTAYVNTSLGTHMSTAQVQDLYGRKCGAVTTPCGNTTPPTDPNPGNGPLLCGKNEAANEPFVYVEDDPCADSTSIAIITATEQYRIYKDSLAGSFQEAYQQKCLNAINLESFTVTHPVSEYHYTLYYYDQAGNLVKTVPPEGVHPNRDRVWLDQVAQKREANQSQVPAHTLVTVYRYNSLNQVVTQQSPDGGLGEFWYDRLGRLAVSRNAKQKLINKYSYTLYDFMGRITEVGQKVQTTAMSGVIARNASQLNNWLNVTYFNASGNRCIAEEVTSTVYDVQDNAILLPMPIAVNQKAYTLRNRVSYTRTYDFLQALGNGNPRYGVYDNSTTYCYDIHGNVDTLLQQYRTGLMAAHGDNRFKVIAYKYDLISGKVNQVHYQPGQKDQLYHRYEYDAENQITDVYISDNKRLIGDINLEDHDAHYDYYKHGPVARAVIGQQQVQGIDYAYTLYGWLKGVNSTGLDSNLDMGGDGKPGQSHKSVARDAYSFGLNYFNGDYNAISDRNVIPSHGAFMSAIENRELYNANISSMTINIGQFNQVQLYNYQYDQLNRLVAMDTYRGYDVNNNNWSALSITTDYRERLSYDANGNIKTYSRNGTTVGGKPVDMDKMLYGYNKDLNGNIVNNRLRHVKDSVAAGNYTEDIDNQGDDNYVYDAVGNLVKDNIEKITDIQWSLYGKILSITKTASASGDTKKISYTYDASGNRISKQVEKQGQPDKYTWYVRDASGNVMATYEYEGNNVSNSTLFLTEHHLYGSSRLGIWNRDENMDVAIASSGNANLLGPIFNGSFKRGNKFFELNNHLSNVLVTVTDKKIGVDIGSDGIVDYYKADVQTANDYYSFGMTMPGRKYNASDLYRYGFNGKEMDNEVKGDGNQQDYGMRIYDPRIGKFLSVDPLAKSYAELSTYQFAGNTPIRAIDLDGNEARDAVTGEVLTQFNTPSSIPTYKSWMDLMTINTNSKQIYEQANNRLNTYINGYTTVKKQTLAGAYSKTVSVDYYSVNISKLPPAFKTANELFEHIRVHFSEFMKGGSTAMSELTPSEQKVWETKGSISAVMHFDVYQAGINTEDFNVINIKTTADYWLFQTVSTSSLQDQAINEDREHPLGGVRQFGLQDNQNGSFTFYTRGADSPYGFIDTQVQGSIFKGANKLWNAVMKNITEYINKNGGQAQVGPQTQQKYNWEDDMSEEDRQKAKAQKEN